MMDMIYRLAVNFFLKISEKKMAVFREFATCLPLSG
jgi:hypothetical protein